MNAVFINYPLETFTPTQSGAIATIIHELCVAAQGRGESPTVISRRSEATPFTDVDARFYDYPRLPGGMIGTFALRAQRKLGGWRHFRHHAYARRVMQEIRVSNSQQRPLILFNDPETAVVLREQFPKARIVHWFQNQHACKEGFRKRFAKAAITVAACSRFTADWVEHFYELPAGSVRVVHNGVDTQLFAPKGTPESSTVTINFVGRTGIEKGPDILLRAALELSNRRRDFSIQLLGSNHWGRLEMDEYQRELSSLAGQLESRQISIRRPGHVTRAALPGELRRAHIHVVPARWDEPFGMTTIEGMACGLATIASSTGGTPEVVGDAAMLFGREDYKSLADHLDALIGDEDARHELARRGRERAMFFDWTRCSDRLNHVIASVN